MEMLASVPGRRPAVSDRKLKRGLDADSLSIPQKKETISGLLVGWVSYLHRAATT